MIKKVILFVLSLSFYSQIANGAKTYNVYIDKDNKATTGCTVLQPDFSTQFDGIDGYISVETGGASVAIVNSLYHKCVGSSFDAGSAIVDSALGLNTGAGGDDVFEVQIATSDLSISSSTVAHLYFSSESDTSSDIVSISNTGGAILFGVAFPIPLLSITSLLILTLFILFIARKVIKSKKFITGFVLLVPTLVWSVFSFVIDGQVNEWSSFTAIDDPIGDNSTPGSFSDITHVYANLERDYFTARIDVVDVENTAPTANDVADTLFEDNTLLITMTGADADGDSLSFVVDSAPANGSLSVVTAINATSGSILYTPNADYVGSDSFTYFANDGQANSIAATVNLTIDPVNDAPSFTSGGDVTVLEDSAAYSSVWATAISSGPSDESAQTTSFTIVNVSDASLFTVQPLVNASGNLSFTPAVDAAGTSTVTINISDDGGTANGGVDTSADMTFDIILTNVNDVPSFTKGADQTVLEDTGAQTVAGWATALLAGPANEASQILSFNVVNTNNAMFSVQPSVSSNGTLTYTSAANAVGTAIVTVNIMDDGGTANGGVDTSANQTFNITFTAVNDAPSFTSGGDINVLEDSGAFSVAWATSISTGPADESGQVLTGFNVTSNSNPGLFSILPSVNTGGTLSFTTAAEMFGTATLSIELTDNGGTANGGVDTSVAQMFTITVVPVNDEPQFAKGPDQNGFQNAGAQTINAWVVASSVGPANEVGQTLSYNVSNDNNTLFSAQPSVNPAGDLSYTAAMNMTGMATVTINVMDNGGTANGGDDTSSNQMFDITITNPPPAKADPTFSASTNIQVNTPAGSGLLSGATGGGTLVVGNAMNPAPTTTTGGGNLNITTATGAFTYNPPAGMDSGMDTFTYKICNATQCSADITATFNLSGNTTWFVDTSAAAGDGRLTTPFNSISAFDAKQGGGTQDDPAIGDCIFLAAGNYTGPLTLLDAQKVIGTGTMTTVATECSLAPVTNSVSLPSTNASRPLISSATIGVNLASGNTLRGFNIGNAITKLEGNNFGLLTINNMALSGTGKAIDLTTGTVAVNLDSINSSNSASEGLDLSLVSAGNFTVTGLTTVDNATGVGVSIANVGATYSFGNVTITNRNSAGVFINAFTGGVQNGSFGTITIDNPNSSGTTALGIDNAITAGSTITIASAVINNNNSNSSAIALSNNDGATININGGSVTSTLQPTVSITNSSGVATYAGTITQNNAATALRVLNNTGGTTTISGMITANTTTVNAMNLDAHGTLNITGGMALTTTSGSAFTSVNAGTLNVTGTNTVSSTTGTAVEISDVVIGASNVTFQSVSSNGSTTGINLDSLTGSGSVIITGTGSVAGTGGTIQNTTQNGLLVNSSSNISLSNMNFTNANTVDTGAANTNAALEFITASNVNLDNLNITGHVEHGILGTSISNLDISNTNITGTGADTETNEHGIFISNLFGTSGSASIFNNLTINDSQDTAILIVNNANTGQLTIQDTAITNAGDSGINAMTTNAAATLTVNVAGNTIVNTVDGISYIAEAGMLAGNVGGAGALANVINAGAGGNMVNGILFFSNGIMGNLPTMDVAAISNTITLDAVKIMGVAPVSGLNGVGISTNGSGTIRALVNDNTINSSFSGVLTQTVHGVFVNNEGTGSTADNVIGISNNTITLNPATGTATAETVGIGVDGGLSGGGVTVRSIGNTIESHGDASNGASVGIQILPTETGDPAATNNRVCIRLETNNVLTPNNPFAGGLSTIELDVTAAPIAAGSFLDVEGITLGVTTPLNLKTQIEPLNTMTEVADATGFVNGVITGVASCPN